MLALGGTLRIEPAPERGTRVSVQLPVASADDATTKETRDPYPACRPLHAVVREGYRRLLERRADLRVEAEAGSAEEALQILREGQPDLTIPDLSRLAWAASSSPGASSCASQRPASWCSACTATRSSRPRRSAPGRWAT